MGVFVVVPAYNEASSLGEVLTGLRRDYPQVVVVDDGSTDETFAAALSAGAQVLRHVLNRGQGAALQTGLEYSLSRGAEVIVTFDADGQHEPADVAALIQPILEGRAEIVLGSRFLGRAEDIPLSRRLLLQAGVLFTRLTSGMKLTDTHNGLRAFSRRAAGHIRITLDGMAHASELVDQIRQSRLPYLEVPVRVRYTRYSRAKGQKGRDLFRIVVNYVLRRILG